DRKEQVFHFYQTDGEANVKSKLNAHQLNGVDDPRFQELLAGPRKNLADAEELHSQLEAEMELLEIAGDPYNEEEILSGKLSPVFFGSAMNNFGVQMFLEKFIEMAPHPTARKTLDDQSIEPTADQF